MPITDQEKLSRFAEDTLIDASHKAQEILDKTKEEHDNKIEEGRKEILLEKNEYILSEKKKVWREISRNQSTQTMKFREELLLCRRDLIDTLTLKVKEKLEQFTKSEKYIEYLKKLCLIVAQEYPVSFTIYLSENDSNYKFEILEALDNQVRHMNTSNLQRFPLYSIMESADVKIGGARFFSGNDNILIDKTLDATLLASKSEIIQMIGPVVKEY